jgi:DNA-directed RNA polymerase specialized sigma subunit
MIKTDAAYHNAVERLRKDEEYLAEREKALQRQGLTSEEIQRVLEPELSFHQQLCDEVAWYQKARRGDPQAISNFNQMGRLLIALRIASGLSQRELAERLGVHESQVSRDERHEYYGISVDRVQAILDVLGVNVCVTAEPREKMLRVLEPA